jgi:hypothetical protein
VWVIEDTFIKLYFIPLQPIPRASVRLYWIAHFPARLVHAAYNLTVRNRTASPPSPCQHPLMLHRKSRSASDSETRASIKKEMAKPRMTKSARIAQQNLETARIAARPTHRRRPG